MYDAGVRAVKESISGVDSTQLVNHHSLLSMSIIVSLQVYNFTQTSTQNVREPVKDKLSQKGKGTSQRKVVTEWYGSQSKTTCYRIIGESVKDNLLQNGKGASQRQVVTYLRMVREPVKDSLLQNGKGESQRQVVTEW